MIVLFHQISLNFSKFRQHFSSILSLFRTMFRQNFSLHKRSKQHLLFCMDPLVVRKVPLIRHHHLVLANHHIWIRMPVKVGNHHGVLIKAYTWEQGEISKISKDLILSIKQIMLMRKPDVRSKNLRRAREWEITDFGRFAFGNFNMLLGTAHQGPPWSIPKDFGWFSTVPHAKELHGRFPTAAGSYGGGAAWARGSDFARAGGA
jgi:hypothetical protein